MSKKNKKKLQIAHFACRSGLQDKDLNKNTIRLFNQIKSLIEVVLKDEVQ